MTIEQREHRLIQLSAVFLFIYSMILTLAPAVRAQTLDTPLRLSHWIGFGLWCIFAFIFQRIIARVLPDRDPILFPLALLLSGWGLLTIWRLDSGFGLRQSLWLGVSLTVLTGIIYLVRDVNFLRRYKYLLLGSGLLLTALTLVFGANPAGAGQRLWLGCCGVYLQPSEPLKLLLVIYLSAYLAEHFVIRQNIFPFLLPTLFIAGLAISLLLVQRDLGTASILILLFTNVLFLATGKFRVLLATGLGLFLAGVIGYFLIDVVHTRINVWLDPWSDPSGHAYQTVQSLLAIASGGTIGRGPGLGSPGLVPVAHSDFIFSAMAEETGLTGILGLLIVYGLLISRGLIASFNATDRFKRLLAAGLTAYLGIQTLLIIGGNLRDLPLTGETLPFVAYGGSSLLTAFIALALLLIISNRAEVEAIPLASPRPYFFMAALFGFGIITASLTSVWWSVVRAPNLLARTDNPRRSIADRYVLRGGILDRNNAQINITEGAIGDYRRVYVYSGLAPIVGYTNPIFGQAGLESSLDDYLRGLQGNPSGLIWWDHLLYGMPPPGLNVRLTIDLELQKIADQSMMDFKGALVLLNAQTGEILIMASHPGYDPNKLDQIGPQLAQDPNTPLVNRSAQGSYPIGSASEPFILTAGSGAPLTAAQLMDTYKAVGFYSAPQVQLPVSPASTQTDTAKLQVSPLQMAIAAACLSHAGECPAPRIVLAVDTLQQGWIVLPPLSQPVTAFSASSAAHATAVLTQPGQNFWGWTGRAESNGQTLTWYLAGTPSNWLGTPLSLAVILESDNPSAAKYIGQQILQAAVKP